MKKLLTKAEIRALLEKEMNLFERDGGRVTVVPQGISGRDPLDNSPPDTRRLFLEPTTKRTHLPEVIAAIEARRKEKLTRRAKPKPRPRLSRRRKTIYDDFGEPLRRVWIDD